MQKQKKKKTKLSLTNSRRWRNLNSSIEKQKSIMQLKGFAYYPLQSTATYKHTYKATAVDESAPTRSSRCKCPRNKQIDS